MKLRHLRYHPLFFRWPFFHAVPDWSPPSWHGEPWVSVRVAGRWEIRHRLLKWLIQRPTTCYLWVPEHAITFRPPLSNVVYGDGKALLAVTTIQDRPAYWTVRVDSAWVLSSRDRKPDGAFDIDQIIVTIMDNLALEFGDSTPERYIVSYDELCPECEGGGCFDCHGTGNLLEDEVPDYPAINMQDGYSWGREPWPLPSWAKLALIGWRWYGRAHYRFMSMATLNGDTRVAEASELVWRWLHRRAFA